MNQHPLPKSLKFAVALSLILAVFVGYFALGEAFGMNEIATQKGEVERLPLQGSTELVAVVKAGLQSHLSFLEGTKTSRQFILGALWLATFWVLAGAMRVLRHSHQQREKAITVLSRSCLVVSVLRFVDGAQNTALWHHTGKALEKMMVAHTLPALEHVAPEKISWVLVSAASLYTFLIAGFFLTLSMYFSSNKVQQQLSNFETAPR